MLGQPANAGHRRVTIAAGARARQIFEGLEELCRHPLPEISPTHHGCGHRRRQLEIGDDAADHGHRISDRCDFDCQKSNLGNCSHGHGAKSDAVGARDKQNERNIRYRIEINEAVAISNQQFAAADNRHPGA